MKPALLTKRIPNVSLADLPALLKGAGFSAANLCVRDGHPVSPENVSTQLVEAARIFVDEGISFPRITTRGDFVDPNDRGVEETLAACNEASVQLVKIGYWILEGNDYHALFDTARKAMEGFAVLAKKHGVRIAVHTHSGAFLTNTAAGTLALLKDLNPKFVGAYADVGHLHLNGEPADMALDILQDYVAIIGMQDSLWRQENGDWERSIVPVGEGMVNWTDVKKRLHKTGFNGPLAFHTDHSPPTETPFDETAKAELDFWSNA